MTQGSFGDRWLRRKWALEGLAKLDARAGLVGQVAGWRVVLLLALRVVLCACWLLGSWLSFSVTVSSWLATCRVVLARMARGGLVALHGTNLTLTLWRGKSGERSRSWLPQRKTSFFV